MDAGEVRVGFGLALAMNPRALSAYSALSDAQRQSVLDRAHHARSRDEMQQIINEIGK